MEEISALPQIPKLDLRGCFAARNNREGRAEKDKAGKREEGSSPYHLFLDPPLGKRK